MLDDTHHDTFPHEARPHTTRSRVVDLEALLAGAFHVSSVHRSCESYVFDLTPSAPVGRFEPREREQRIISALLSGWSQKQMSFELCLAPATISHEIRQLVRRVGVTRWEHFVAIACALHADPVLTDNAEADCQPVRVSASVRPQVLAALTPAEREVVLCVADGLSNAQIALCRRTSPRTIANQIAGVFRKLKVTGRLELVLRMLADARPPSAD